MKLFSNTFQMEDSDNKMAHDEDGVEDFSQQENEDHINEDRVNDTSDLPSSLIIANVDIQIYEDDDERERFEDLFRTFDPSAAFQYLKSFRRVRVNFSTTDKAAKARIQLHEAEICGRNIKCYFAQKANETDSGDPHLQPPAPFKQFLISPPASPPVGWEPVLEAEPTLNYDLLSAIANLAPGEAHELHPPSETQPAIVVHICEETENNGSKLKIAATRCPER